MRRRSSGRIPRKCRVMPKRPPRVAVRTIKLTDAWQITPYKTPGRGTVERGDDRISLKVIFSGRFIF